MTTPLAHSARADGKTQSYAAHVAGVKARAKANSKAMLCFLKDEALRERMREAIIDAADAHDLGKLDPDTQAALHGGRGAKLNWDHIDAGVAHLRAHDARMAAWLVRAHHAPGLPAWLSHFNRKSDRGLRGRRRDGDMDLHAAQIARTDAMLPELVAAHQAELGPHAPRASKEKNGLAMRFALSCLVDADHSNTAIFDSGWRPPRPGKPRWRERLAALDKHVAALGQRPGARNDLRRAFYEACRARAPDTAMMACEGPVGIGKTTAVLAFLLRRAAETGARRLFIVAPYTAILSQTAARLREALLLDDERDNPDAVIAEHHHRADFVDVSSRDLAALWSAPIILTTAVQFFETLSSNEPSTLRKLHMLPGSAVFFDEAHAMLPVTADRKRPSTGTKVAVSTAILPQYWRWLEELAAKWSCSFVFASGSLARFWEIEDLAGDHHRRLPDLVTPALVEPLARAEAMRIRYRSLGRAANAPALIECVVATPGPRLVIMNTVQSAAVMARAMRAAGHDVLHLSTALCPRDRDRILEEVRKRLDPSSRGGVDWTLVATSLMEAGVDVSFRTGFRERFATTSLVQIGGRINRNSEYGDGADVYDFLITKGEGLTSHPDARAPSAVLQKLFEGGALEGQVDPAGLVTNAMVRQMRDGQLTPDLLGQAEQDANYPDVASLARLIDADTRFVIVDPTLRERVAARDRLALRDILAGSVQMWSHKIDAFALEPVAGRTDVYWWPHGYDAAFLGYMDGALRLEAIAAGAAFIL